MRLWDDVEQACVGEMDEMDQLQQYMCINEEKQRADF